MGIAESSEAGAVSRVSSAIIWLMDVSSTSADKVGNVFPLEAAGHAASGPKAQEVRTLIWQLKGNARGLAARTPWRQVVGNRRRGLCKL